MGVNFYTSSCFPASLFPSLYFLPLLLSMRHNRSDGCVVSGTFYPENTRYTKFLQHSVQQHPVTRILCSLYPGLHDLFVNRCGVDEFPHFYGYLQILLHLSAVVLPSQEAEKVFRIFLKWADELKSVSLGFEDVFLEKSLKEK